VQKYSGLRAAESEGDLLSAVDKAYFESVHLFAVGESPNNEPPDYNQAISAPDADQWWIAMRDEMDSLKRLGVWEVVPQPEGRNIIGCKWVYRLKENALGEIVRYKAVSSPKGIPRSKDMTSPRPMRQSPGWRPSAFSLLSLYNAIGRYVRSM